VVLSTKLLIFVGVPDGFDELMMRVVGGFEGNSDFGVNVGNIDGCLIVVGVSDGTIVGGLEGNSDFGVNVGNIDGCLIVVGTTDDTIVGGLEGNSDVIINGELVVALVSQGIAVSTPIEHFAFTESLVTRS